MQAVKTDVKVPGGEPAVKSEVAPMEPVKPSDPSRKPKNPAFKL